MSDEDRLLPSAERNKSDYEPCPMCPRSQGWYLERFSDDYLTNCRVCGGSGRIPKDAR